MRLADLRDQAKSAETELIRVFEKAKAHLPHAHANDLAKALKKKQNAMYAFIAARKRTHNYGSRLEKQARENMALPSDRVLKKLHRLIRKMRRAHKAALAANEAFHKKLRSALQPATQSARS